MKHMHQACLLMKMFSFWCLLEDRDNWWCLEDAFEIFVPMMSISSLDIEYNIGEASKCLVLLFLFCVCFHPVNAIIVFYFLYLLNNMILSNCCSWDIRFTELFLLQNFSESMDVKDSSNFLNVHWNSTWSVFSKARFIGLI